MKEASTTQIGIDLNSPMGLIAAALENGELQIANCKFEGSN
jgi:hypothetical protein